MRPYIPSPRVGDIGKELPHYYCNQHNPNTSTYPVKPGSKVTIVKEPAEEPDDPGVIDDPDDPNYNPPNDNNSPSDSDNPDNNSGIGGNDNNGGSGDTDTENKTTEDIG